MDEQVNQLVDKVWDLQTTLLPSHRALIAIAGIPGSGKTTIATTLVTRLNDRYRTEHPALAPSHGPLAARVGMDGFHFSREVLDGMPDPVVAHARRGAAFTFDARAYLALVRKLRAPIAPEQGSVFAPTFDHKVKDPVEGGVEVGRGVSVVVFEGNYVALEGEPGEPGESASNSGAGRSSQTNQTGEEGGKDEAEAGDEDDSEPQTSDACWAHAKSLMDLNVFVSVDEAIARRRLVARHVAAGIAKDEAEAGRRADENDLVNGREVVRRRGRVDIEVESVEEGGWRD